MKIEPIIGHHGNTVDSIGIRTYFYYLNAKISDLIINNVKFPNFTLFLHYRTSNTAFDYEKIINDNDNYVIFQNDAKYKIELIKANCNNVFITKKFIGGIYFIFQNKKIDKSIPYNSHYFIRFTIDNNGEYSLTENVECSSTLDLPDECI